MAREKQSKQPKRPVDNRIALQKSAMLIALQKSLGNVSGACSAVGVSRQTHYDWYKKDADYKTAVDNVSESTIDFVESKLLNKINSGDTIAAIFYLKTRGKHRGYVEKTEYGMTDSNGEDVKPKKQVIIIAGKEIEF